MLKSVIFVVSYFITVSSTNTCNFNVKIQQTLRNEGFHRNITYEIMFNGDEDDQSVSFRDCIVSLDQTLPSGVYANPDELGDLKRANKLNAIPKNRINIELPAEQSSPSGVYILGKVTGDQLSLWLPVHARYHQAAPGGGTARNRLAAPRLRARCPAARLRCAGADSPALPALCDDRPCWKTYKEIPYTMTTEVPVWAVPVGDTRHYRLVAGGSALAVLAGSLHLLRAVHGYKLAQRG